MGISISAVGAAPDANTLSTNAQGNIQVGDGNLLGSVAIPHISAWTQVTGTWAIANFNTNDQLGFKCPTTQNAEINLPIYLVKGTYTLSANFMTNATHGQGRFYLNTTALGGGVFETYSAALGTTNVTITGISVATSGQYTLKLTVPSKNASSSNYTIQIHNPGVVLTKTA